MAGMPHMICTEDAVRGMVRAAASAAGGQRALARKLGISAAFINQIILSHRPPTGKILRYLKLRRTVSVTYESA